MSVSAAALSHFELAIGGSLVAEELKGDPGRAVSIATAAVADARAKGQASKAAARTDLGLALILQGLPGAARPHLEEAIRTGAAEVALLAGLYERMATSLRYNTFPNGQGAGGTEISARWDGVADEEAAAERLDGLAGRVGRSQVPAVRRLTQLVTALASIRSSLDMMRFVPQPLPGLLDQLLPSLLSLEEAGVPRGWAAFGRLGAADACRRAGEPARGQALLAAALEAYQEAGDAAGQGVCHLVGADWMAAPFSSPLDWNLAVRESASEGSDLDWRVEAAEAGEEGMDLDGARAGYDLAAARFEEAGAPRGLAAVELRRGYLAVLAADHERAAAHAGASRDRFTAAGDTAGAGIAAIHHALARIGAGALAEDRAAVGTVGAWGARDGSFSIALGLGLLCGRVGRHWRLRRGDPERALACYRLAAALFEALGARLNLAQSLVDQADVLRGVGSVAQAGAQYELAVEVTGSATGSPPPVAEVARRRSLLLAVEVLQDHHARQDPDGMERASNQVVRWLGVAAPAETDPAEQAVVELARWLLSQLPTAVPLARAMALRDRGDAEEARPWFDQALAGARAMHPDAGVRHLLEASVLASQERYAEALDHYRRYAAVRDGPGGDTAMAGALGAEQQLRARRNGLEQDLAFLTRVKAWSQAQAAADACQALAGDRWWSEDERPWSVLSDLGEVLEGLGQLASALDRYEQAMQVFEARRGQVANVGMRAAMAGARDMQWLAILGARCALRLADADPSRADAALARALASVERGKARALLDLMARSAAFAAGRSGDSPALRRWRELGAQADITAQLLERSRRAMAAPEELVSLERRLTAQQQAVRDVEEELTRTEPGWLGGVRAAEEVASLDEVAAAVPAGAALLQWCFLGHDLLAWAITGDGMVARDRQELDTRKLGRAIRELRAACEGRAPGWQASAEALAATLLDPFASVLADHERIVAVPYGVAHELPVHVLPWQGRALGETHSVSVIPSASVLRYAHGSSRRRWRVLAVGDPARMAYRPPGAARAEPAPPLRGAGAEAAIAAAAFPGGELLGGEAATEHAVRSRIADFPVLHFATHGQLDHDAPGRSSLLLADGDALSVYELAGMELDVDLAVLSACRTGQGEATKGDDVIGLARGLLGAGCRAAVVSLWPVDDASTTILMAAFYRRLAGGSTPVDALRAAQLHVRGLGVAEAAAELSALRAAIPAGARDVVNRMGPLGTGYDHPYHWAPFVLMGTGADAPA